VAKYLFKLMAYKDEYEVARLYTDGKFQKKIADMFEGDYAGSLPPRTAVVCQTRCQGTPDQEHGPWMMKVFGVLAKMKFLRGMFD
jgi:indolepyruvate ferredoxin oxidoreductase